MTDYVDAGEAVPHKALSATKGEAPATGDVNFERIKNARSEPENWLTYYGTYDAQRYSALDQIDKESVKKLVPAWVFQAGSVGLSAGSSTYSFESSPLVVEGVMYVSGPDGKLWAIDAVTGEELWRYKHASPYDVSLCCGNVNRGVAVGHGKVYLYTLNAHLIALDATSGELQFDVINGDVRAGESGTVAPLIVKDMVVVGSSGDQARPQPLQESVLTLTLRGLLPRGFPACHLFFLTDSSYSIRRMPTFRDGVAPWLRALFSLPGGPAEAITKRQK